MRKLVDGIAAGSGTRKDLELLERITATMRKASLCGLGQTAPTPVLTALRYFSDEYEAHIDSGRCISGACGVAVGGMKS